MAILSRFCRPFGGALSRTRRGVNGVRVTSRISSIPYRGYKHVVICGRNEFNGFLTYPNCPRYGGAGSVAPRLGIPYPGYKDGIRVEGSGGNTACCAYRGKASYFVS